MPVRSLLHKNDLDLFIKYLDHRCIPHRPGRGDYEVLQVQRADGTWTVLWRRDKMPEHFTVEDRMVPLVQNFIDWKHQQCSTHDTSTPPSGT